MSTTIEPYSQLPLQPTPDQDWFIYCDAYDIVLDAERHAMESGPEGQDNLLFARVAGFLLIEFFDKRAILSVEPCASLALEIVSSPLAGTTTHDLVFNLGKQYYDYFIFPYRTSIRRYPAPPPRFSRPSFDTIEEMTTQFMKASSKSRGAVKNKALARDGFRCAITGRFDSECLLQNRELDQKCEEQLGGLTDVQLCHILGESVMQGYGGDGTVANKGKCAPTPIAFLKHFGLGSPADKLLAADGVHHFANLLSLSSDMHSQFDELNLWFEATDEPDCYSVCTYHHALKRDLTRFGYLHQAGDRLLVTFSSHITGAQLPDCKLLTLHAVCARVAHLSGAAEVIDELELDDDELEPDVDESIAFDRTRFQGPVHGCFASHA